MKAYADTNFLLRLFLVYEDSDRAIALLDGLGSKMGACPVTWLQNIEYTNSVHLLVFQSRAGALPRVTPELAAIAQNDFTEALARGSSLREAVLNHRELTAGCRSLSERHTSSHGLRTYDVVHVASALLLQCDTFWSFDAKASKLAKLEGLKVL